MADSSPNLQKADPPFLGDSEMAGRMRAFDWSASDLGPVASWPENLRVAIGLCLTSRFPLMLWWGPRKNVLYNDAYAPFLGEKKHPEALGQPGCEVWQEIWDTVGPMLESVYATGRAVSSKHQVFFIVRDVPREEVHLRFAYGPMFSTDGKAVQGVFCPCTEITDEVIATRRLDTLRKLGVQTTAHGSVEEACEEAAKVLAENAWCMSFAAIYLVNADATDARLQSSTGAPEAMAEFPSVVAADDEDSPWPLATVLKSRRAVEVADLIAAGVNLPAAYWSDPVQQAVALPVFGAHGELAGLVLLGISPRRPFDARYRTFFDLVAGHIGTAMSRARALEHERHSADEALQMARSELARVARLTTMSELASSIAHELNQPLGAIVNNGSVCLRLVPNGPDGQGEVRDALEDIVRDANRASAVIQRVRAATKRLPHDKVPLQISDLTDDVLMLARRELLEREITVRTHIAEGLHDVLGDRIELQQVLLNLVINSIEALDGTTDGRRVVTIAAQRAVLDSRPAILLTVHDLGHGIAPEEMARLIEAFYTTKKHGLGMGLRISNSIVEAHGGRLSAARNDGHGVTFSCTLPALMNDGA